jgi:hypothetical protein
MSKEPRSAQGAPAESAAPSAETTDAATPETVDAPAVTYTGDGTQYIDQIPARDLTADEANALTDDQKAAISASGLYDTGTEMAPQRAGAAEPSPAAPPDEAAPTAEAAPAEPAEAATETPPVPASREPATVPPAQDAATEDAPEPTGGGA